MESILTEPLISQEINDGDRNDRRHTDQSHKIFGKQENNARDRCAQDLADAYLLCPEADGKAR
jgi:hypothetical protein